MLRSAAEQTLKGNVVVVDVRVAAEYDAPLAALMVRGEKKSGQGRFILVRQ